MFFERLRRTFLAGGLALALGLTLGLAACGGGSSVISDFKPTRVVVFGDAMSDLKLAANGAGRYTVNGDGTVNNWVLQLANYYSLTPATANVKAAAHARAASTTDAVGGSASSVKAQVTSFLAGSALSAADLVVVGAGTSDLIAEGYKAVTSAQSEAAASAAVKQAARDLATEVRRLVTNGAKHVVVLGPYNLGRTPWATSVSKASFLETLSTDFNDELIVALNDLADNVLFVDARLHMNNLTGSTSYNASTVACNTANSAANPGGLGIGTAKVDSSLCSSTASPSQLDAGYNASTFLFADPVYPTPVAHRSLGNFAYEKLRVRW